jgi:hypothetical protein
MRLLILFTALALAMVAFWITFELTGAGSFKRLVTISGIYPVCKPGGYNVVCFLDADSRQDGPSCLPLEDISPTKECLK